MESKLKILEELLVKDTKKIHEYIQLFFEKDIILNIYNKFNVSNNNDITIIKTSKVTSVKEDTDKIMFVFSNGNKICVDLREEAYNGPEALQLIVPGQPIIIW